MSKHRQTTKHKKQVKKEKANRKATRNTFALSPVPDDLELGKTAPVLEEVEYPREDRSAEAQPDAPPISAARKALQNK